jgi:purine-cytosine permease-like protein
MGWWPSKLIVLLNVVQMIGYCLIDCVVGGQILSAVSPGSSMSVAVGKSTWIFCPYIYSWFLILYSLTLLGIVVVAVITWGVATFGITIFHYYER